MTSWKQTGQTRCGGTPRQVVKSGAVVLMCHLACCNASTVPLHIDLWAHEAMGFSFTRTSAIALGSAMLAAIYCTYCYIYIYISTSHHL